MEITENNKKYGHGHAQGPQTKPQALYKRKRDRLASQQVKKTEPLYLTPWATSPDLRKAGPFSWKLPKRQYFKGNYKEKHVGDVWQDHQSNSEQHTYKSKKFDENRYKIKENIRQLQKTNETLRNLHNSKENQGIPQKSKNIIRNLKKIKENNKNQRTSKQISKNIRTSKKII